MERMGFFARLWMMFWLPWKVLFSPPAAMAVRAALPKGEPPRLPPARPEPAKEPEPVKGTKPPREERGPESFAPALHLLAILQRDGRLVDFLQEDIAGATDEQVGAAARVVHEGCRDALARYVTLAPVRSEAEGAAVKIPAGFDPGELRLTGNVTGQPPFQGRLAHAGWRAKEVKLPTLAAGQDPAVIAPAEVEV
ncbi:MAG TPA: DUF2760 domain-containing protein [Vulgatibacter sp.]